MFPETQASVNVSGNAALGRDDGKRDCYLLAAYGRSKTISILGRWAGETCSHLRGAGSAPAETVRRVDSGELRGPVDSSEINESLSNGHQARGDRRPAWL
jgi:hypothetical protein